MRCCNTRKHFSNEIKITLKNSDRFRFYNLQIAIKKNVEIKIQDLVLLIKIAHFGTFKDPSRRIIILSTTNCYL